MITPQEVTRLLSNENLRVSRADEGDNYWVVGFDVEGKNQTAVVLLPPNGDYLLLVEIPKSDKLKQPLDALSAEALRTLVRVASQVPLAKVIFSPPNTYLVTSECSVEGVTSHKLRRRLEACAVLAAKLDLALA